VQTDKQVPVAAAHENGTQMCVEPGLQSPLPSQAFEPTTASPSHIPGLHIVFTGYLRQPPAPSHLPSVPQVDAGVVAQVVASRGSAPAVRLTQVPSELGAAHVLQPPAHASAHAVQLRGTGPGCEAPARITIVLGLLEKRFPRQPRQDPFLGDELRTALRERFGWDLTTSADAMDRERDCFARAVSSATETLYLSYSSIDSDGRPAVRSFFIDDLQATLDAEIPVERLAGATAIVPVDEATRTTDLVASVAHDIWQYLPRTADSETRRAMAFRALESLARRDANVSVVRHGRRVSQKPALDGVMPDKAPHLTLTLSASQLKSISQCTYKHFVEKVLDPKELVPPEYNALSKGSLIHDAIMHWATGLHGWTRGEDALPELDDWIRKKIAEWPPSKRGKDRAARAMDADIARLDELLRKELDLLRSGDFAQVERITCRSCDQLLECAADRGTLTHQVA